jgi:aquaporin Z
MPFTAPEVGRRMLAELLGTFALTAVAAGVDMAAALAPGEVDHVARALAPAVLVLALIYAIGDVSGAHLNPAVTAAFALRGIFPWRLVVPYWLAQLAGAILAALVLRSVLGDVAHVGANEPHVAASAALAIEVFLTAVLVTVILGTADRKGLVGTEAAIAVGAAIAMCGLVGLSLSGASMNPARSLGPALVAGQLGQAWIYVAGPLIGAAVAVAVAFALHGPAPRDEEHVKAAQGE